jgi:predicted RNA binding protein YcfA (HicA-like mRNA interferase family)
MKVREIIKIIETDGWYLKRTKGSHRQFKNDNKPGLVTVAGHPNDDLAIKTSKSIFKQAGIENV